MNINIQVRFKPEDREIVNQFIATGEIGAACDYFVGENPDANNETVTATVRRDSGGEYHIYVGVLDERYLHEDGYVVETIGDDQ